MRHPLPQLIESTDGQTQGLHWSEDQHMFQFGSLGNFKQQYWKHTEQTCHKFSSYGVPKPLPGASALPPRTRRAVIFEQVSGSLLTYL
jgi:hypothetical protein